ncbi:lysophospholipid acyltransferase family protein [Roseibium sp. TrichSKD4]|uniref:lysophospholipid acyltransferase family protein n=1 Tax=Roseibium sp. TrichSKD4 TaxID=744980 RepID=UPI00058B3F84|nr:lysophospholipid acyltransferase family protein [Roseibium sp. TrichSKD4]
MLKSLGRNPRVLRAVGVLMAEYLRFVHRTNRFTVAPEGIYEMVGYGLPYIIAMWHGQHFMMPFTRPSDVPVKVMISRSADGEINAVAAERLGIGLIRASGSQKKHQIKKRGGMRGFIECLRTLKEGDSVALTADVPKGPARVAGLGIVQIAKHSGRPILPIAICTSRSIELNSWDKASINLPFGKGGIAFGEPIHVAKEATDEELEAARLAVENGLNDVTETAYTLVGRPNG